jgi:radical SAM protein with 4Fe4S-binding SPASM domain
MNRFNGKELSDVSEDIGFLYLPDSVPFFPFRILHEDNNRISHPVNRTEIFLNDSGYWIVNLCDGYHSFYEIVLQTAKAYKVNYNETLRKTELFLDHLTKTGFLWWRRNRMQYYHLPPPMAVLWDLTSRCNLKCHHCVVNSGPGRKDQLSLKKCLSLIEELANFGVKQLILSGGEPLVRHDFFTIANYAVKKGFSVQLASNATLITRDVAKKIAKLGLYMQISLDGINPETHEKFRNKKGSWNKTISGVKVLIKEGVMVSVAAVATTLNVEELPDLYRYVKKLGAYSFRIMPFVTFGRGYKCRDLEIKPSRMLDLTLTLQKLKDELKLELVPMEFECTLKSPINSRHNASIQHIGCDGAIAYCTITATGEVLPCNFFVGVETYNVKDKSFEEIWNESRILNYFRSLETSDIEGQCRSCNWLAECRTSCIAANFAEGKMFQSNVHCWLVKKI